MTALLTTAATAEPAPTRRKKGGALRSLRRNPKAMTGLIIFVIFLILAVMAGNAVV